MAFAGVFTIEAVIKIIADGFFLTPNAYFRSSWGIIDGIVLITLWINVITLLSNDGAVSRAVGAFKALRALRLLNVSDSARETFHSLIINSGWKIISVSTLSPRPFPPLDDMMKLDCSLYDIGGLRLHLSSYPVRHLWPEPI